MSIDFGSDASVSTLTVNRKTLVRNLKTAVDVKKTSFSLDYYSNTFHAFIPSRLKVISETPDEAHVMYIQNKPGLLRLEYHIIMKRGLSGIYSYVKVKNTQKETISIANMRTVYRFIPSITNKATNGEKEGLLPLYADLQKLTEVQDETWRFPNGTYFSKYDYATYIRDHSYRGVFGGGYGAWMLLASHEYYSGGPLKQDLHVHQDALIINCLTASHYGTNKLIAPPKWSKLFGPWLIYFNKGTDDEVKADAIRQSKVEQSLWPYKWMNEKTYPLIRGTIKGRVTGPDRIMVVLHSSLTEKFDLQTLGYTYNTETSKNGSFTIKNITPGKYKLTAYPLSGYGIGAVVENEVNVIEGEVDAGTLHLDVPTAVLWSIGETNRKSDSYRFSDASRNYVWQTLTPTKLEFEIGKSKINTDWYYAQTHNGTWSIRYKDTPDGRTRILRIGLAAASKNQLGLPTLEVGMNGKLLNIFKPESDPSIYRGSLTSGNFHAFILTIPTNLVKKDDNVINLTTPQGSVMYDSINLSIGKKCSN